MEEQASTPWPDEGKRSSRRWLRARWIVVAAAVIGLAASFKAPRQLAALAWSEATGRPPLRVQRAGDVFIVDVQTLGEYMTSVARVRLRAGLEERNLKRPLADHVVLAHELVQAAVLEQAVAVLVDVDAV